MVCKWFEVCPMKRYYEEGLIDKHWLDKYCLSDNNWINCKRYQMEEKGEYHPDNMLPDGTLLKIKKR
ncbi:MAG: uracil-DNA glycosylase [Nitrospiraceae bacterium]|nr:uracil-DNA glycosylase [Nitrospiraceae bacterium]